MNRIYMMLGAIEPDIDLQVVLIVFGILFALVLIAAVVLAVLEVNLNRKRKELLAQARPVEPKATEIASEDWTIRVRNASVEMYETPAEEDEFAIAEAPVSEPEEMPEPIDGVLIPKTEKRAFADKYKDLPEEDKRRLDEFAAYITDKEDCSKILQTSALTFKYKKGQIVKAVIRRETVSLNFAIVNPELNRMIRGEKTGALKVKPVEIRLESDEALAYAKQTADLTIDYLKDEEDYRAEKRREARREAARAKRESDRTEDSADADR